MAGKALNISYLDLYRKFAKPCPRGLWGLNSKKCMQSGKRRNTKSQGWKTLKIK